MKIYVVTKNDETVAVMDNEVSGALHFSDDEFHRYLDNGASTFDLTVAKKHRIYSNATDIEMEDFQYLVANNFLIFTYKNKDYKFTIRRVEEAETSIRLFCEDLSFDLLNEYRGPYIADKAYNIAKYVNDCLYDSGYTIGINEFAKNTRTLKWEGDDTVLKRLLSICNSFDAELEFETQLNNDRTVNKQLVHLRKRVGLNRPDIELKYGREVSSIRRNVDLTELITAIKPRGHENDGKYVTIKNVAKEVKDADGNVAYFTKKGSEYLYAPMANQVYGSPEKKSGGYIVGQFSYDTESDTELYNRALTELQLKCMPAYEYEIEGFYDVDIGDTVRAIDEAYNPILMLEARISEQVISFTDPTRNKTVYSNYRVLNNLVSQSLLDRIDDVKDYAEQVARTYIFSLKNVGSSMFKNGIGEVTYTAKAEKNNKDVTSEFDSFNWTKQLKDGTPDEAWNALHVDFGTTLTVTPDDFEDTATFSYVALKGDETFGGASGVVTKVYDGENGKTPIKGVDYFDGQNGTAGRSAYLHIRYSQNANGTPMTDDPAGAVYVGMLVSQNPTPSTVPADYDWTLVKGADGIPGEPGPDGKTSYLHIKYSDDGGKTFTANNGEAVGRWLGQYVDFTQADSTDVSKYAWSKIKGDTGDDGQTPVVHPAWSWSADGTDRFTTVYPGENLFDQTSYDDNIGYIDFPDGTGKTIVSSNSYRYSDYIPVGGVSVSMNIIETTANSPIGFRVFAYDTAKEFLGNSTQISFNYPRKATWTLPENTAYLRYYYPKKSGSKAKLEIGDTPTIYTPSPSEDYANAYPLYEGTYTDYSETASQNPADYTWRRIIGESGQDGVAGADGKGIKSTEVSYQASTSGTVAPTGNWVANPPTVTKGQYLWTRTIWTYTDDTTETGYSVAYVAKDGNDGTDGIAGKDGVGIKSTAITYAVTSSGTTAPTSGWVASPPTATAGQFMWTKTVWTYTDNTTETGYSVGKIGNNGTNGKDGEDGSNGISVSSVVEEYYVSTSSTTQTGGAWSITVPNNANPNLYVWRRVKNTMSDGTVSYTTPALIQGMTGIYPYIGPTQPANPKEGQQWWKSDSNGNVTDFYVYHDGSWQGQTIQQSVLNIVALNAVNITGSSIVGTTISGATITGSEFVNTFDFLKGFDYYLRGDTTIKDAGIVINAESYQGGNVFYNQRLEYSANVGGLYVQETSPTSQLGERWVLMTPTGIGMYDGRYASTYGQVNLKYQDLITLPQKIITDTTSDFVPYANSVGSTSTPTCDRKMRQVQLSGAFKNTVAFSGAKKMATLPVGYRPAAVVSARCQGSNSNTHYVYVEPDGSIYTDRYSAGTVPLNAWLKIDMTFVAGDL